MAIVVVIVNGRDLGIDTRRRHYPTKSCLALYKELIHCSSHYKQLYVSNKTEHFSYKGGCGISECMHIEMFKRRASLGIDKRLQVISNKMLFNVAH